jgi:hypothetical protein
MNAGIPDTGRQAAHTILDAVSALELNAGQQENVDAMNHALTRLNESGAMHLLADGRIDANDLVGGTLVLVHELVLQLAKERGVGVADVIENTRSSLDQL